MKRTRKALLAVLLSTVMLLAVAVPAFANGTPGHCTKAQHVSAAKWANSMVGKLKYSQARRTSPGYADTSSFIWKAYRHAGYRIGSATNAPTAANEYKLAPHKLSSIPKLKVGDLIFLGGRDNGRYKGIYHVGICVGNGYVVSMAGTEQGCVKQTIADFMGGGVIGKTRFLASFN